MTQVNWQLTPDQVAGYVVTATNWNDVASDLRAFIDQTTSSASDNTPLPLGIDLVNDRVYISDPDTTTPEDGNHADTTLSVVGTTTLNGNTQQTGTFTVGEDDTGHDVIFYGATAGAYVKWNQTTDDLQLVGVAGLDIAGDVDIDGTTNLDEVDIDGVTQIDNTVTVGINDSGWDVKFFGATAGTYLLWDEDADALILNAADLTVGGGDISLGTTAAGETLNIAGVTTASGAGSNLVVAGGDATGTNQGGGYLALQPGMGTGSGVSGDILLQTGPAGGSGTTANTPTTVLTCNSAGNVVVANDLDVDGTTNLDVVDIDGAVDIANTLTITGDYDFTIGTSNTQILAAAAGSATSGAVTYSFSGDPDSGLFRSDADLIHMATGGVTSMTWAADQNVGIGTATPAHPLDVVGASHTYIGILAGTDSSAGLRLRNDARDWDLNITTADEFAIYDQTASATRFRIATDGKVSLPGVGAGEAATGRFQVSTGASWGQTAFAVYITNDDTTIGPQRNVVHIKGGANQSYGSILSVAKSTGYSCFRIRGNGQVAIGTDVGEGGSIGTTEMLDVGGNIAAASTDSYPVVIGVGNTASTGSIAIGTNALAVNTGGNNVAVGYNALNDCTSSGWNTAVGNYALDEMVTNADQYNTAVGYEAASTAGVHATVCVGFRAGLNMTGATNVAIGMQAADIGNISGGNNVSVGFNAGRNGDSGGVNTFVGPYCGTGNTTGSHNTFMGYAAGYLSATGTGNTIIGSEAHRVCTGTGLCTSVGYYSGYYNTGTQCTFLGVYAGHTNGTAVNNTNIGAYAGNGPGAGASTTGGNNTTIGYNAQQALVSSTNSITFGDPNITAVRCATTSITVLSDERDKTDIVDLDMGLDFIQRLRPVRFVWDDRNVDGKHGIEDAGFIAQELQQAQADEGSTLPYLLLDENPDKLEAAMGRLLPSMVLAIQELADKVEALT